MRSDPPNLLPIGRVAECLACSTKQVYALARSGALMGIKIGRRWRFAESEIQRFLARQTQRPMPKLTVDVPTLRRRVVRRPGEAELSLPGADTFL